MPYDIYGQALRPGHCEVHPDVHETYPCSFCLMQADQEAQQRQQYERYCEEQAEEYYREMAIELLENLDGAGI